jgi:hypothetical protein
MKRDVTIEVEGHGTVSGLWLAPEKPRACLVLAHGAGAGMAHASMTAIAEGLKERGIASLRFQFPYLERGSKRVDSPKISHATVRAAVFEGRHRAGKLPLFAGGKSFGGRMTSQAQAEAPLDGVRGLVFFGFPLHPAGAPSVERATHLKDVDIPMLFLQGTNDALADVALLRPALAKLGRRATLKLFADADHSFHVPKRSGRSNAEVMSEVLDSAAAWMFKA